ncbi:predicted protein [Nematostella vectensis]|uniref:Uncharacterized protein n=1 Tax=Nematostella vectensis TaxID=45351 RepID=A7S4Q9_NEMVE|nr:predicted protein [Nematostella vectensis]|eukprot:XP_001633390.1 predicted protein [Nematostella vectensis]
MPKGSKHGYKQSVVQTNTRKRKSTFKGTKKQDKKAQDQREIRQVTEIAFVGDDDVVSEQVPPPQSSASAQKLHDVLEDLSSDDSLNAFEAEGESATGYRFVSMQSLLNFAKRLHANTTCDADPALLARCLPGYTQNANESLNALVWARCPKHKWHGRERVEMDVGSAAIHFSLGATGKHEIMRRAGIEVGSHTEKESKRRDRGRVEKAEKRASDQHKKYRQARSLARKRDEELRLEREGTTWQGRRL